MYDQIAYYSVLTQRRAADLSTGSRAGRVSARELRRSRRERRSRRPAL